MNATSPVYWIDSNVLITAKNGPFRFSVFPGFWDELDEQAGAGRVRVSKLVYDEIVNDGPEDELANWMKVRRANGFCIIPDRDTQMSFSTIADHVQASYGTHQAAKFLSDADPWVIAHALVCNGSVVTFETAQPTAKKVKIPNVCGAVGVSCVGLYDMLQALGVIFRR